MSTERPLTIIANAITSKDSTIKSALPAHVSFDRFRTSALLAISRDAKLQACTPTSIVTAVVRAASLGLEVGSALGEGYLVAYKNECQFIPGYRGMISLARRSGEIVSISANVVHEKDSFDFDLGIHPWVKHKINLTDEDIGPVIAVYAGAVLKDGGDQIIIMRKSEIDAIRKRSRSSGFGPWVSDYEEMAKKTAIRRLFKVLPVSTEKLAQALDLQMKSERGDFSDSLEGMEESDQRIGDLNDLAKAAAENRYGDLGAEVVDG